MAPPYCTVDDIQNILPDNVVIGDSLMTKNVTVLRTDVERWIEFSESIVNSKLVNIYRIPLIPIRVPDFTVDPVTFTERYPDPIPIVCARLAAGHLFDEIVNAQQDPNISEWGKNQRALAHDILVDIMSGITTLRGQVRDGYRFVPNEIYDDARVSRPGEMGRNQRGAGS